MTSIVALPHWKKSRPPNEPPWRRTCSAPRWRRSGAQTESYFQQRDPAQVQRALRDPKHKMALVFRWYLGQSSRWANAGEASRKIDYQVWCGPAMGAFNEWTRGSCLEQPMQRRVVPVARNLLTEPPCCSGCSACAARA